MLIDSGATTSFISPTLAKKCGLPVIDTKTFGVYVGDGRVKTGQGRCQNIVVLVQGVEIVEEYLVFDLGTTDLVLGVHMVRESGGYQD